MNQNSSKLEKRTVKVEFYILLLVRKLTITKNSSDDLPYFLNSADYRWLSKTIQDGVYLELTPTMIKLMLILSGFVRTTGNDQTS